MVERVCAVMDISTFGHTNLIKLGLSLGAHCRRNVAEVTQRRWIISVELANGMLIELVLGVNVFYVVKQTIDSVGQIGVNAQLLKRANIQTDRSWRLSWMSYGKTEMLDLTSLHSEFFLVSLFSCQPSCSVNPINVTININKANSSDDSGRHLHCWCS